MWDETWKPIEHTDFTDKPFIDNDYDNWWSLKYTMSIEVCLPIIYLSSS